MTASRVVVVGGGIVGAASAYFLARDGADVTLIERETMGYGASGRNPGFVWLHARNPGFALEVALAGRRLYDDLVQDLPLDFEFRDSGGVIFFTTEEQGRVFEEFVALRRGHGLDMHLIDGAAVRDLVPPVRPDVLGASYCPLDAQINTPKLVAALARGAVEQGATICEGTAATRIMRSGERIVGVDTDRGPMEADAVVCAAGVWSARLLATSDVQTPIGAERLQVIATHPLSMRIEPVVYGPLAAKQYQLFRELPSYDHSYFTAGYEHANGIEMLELVSQRADGSVLVGCPMDYPAELDARPTMRGLAATLLAIGEDFPGLIDAPVDRVWAGLLPYTSDTAPIIDQPLPGLFIASGHVYGNAAGPMTGKLISQLVHGREPELDLSECRLDRELQPALAGVPVRW